MKLKLLLVLMATFGCLMAEPWKPPADAGETSLSEAESERYQTLTNRVIRSANERTELADGFRYVLDGETAEPAEVIEWMRLERKNIPFVSFSLHLTADGELLLDLRGPDGVKELLLLELPPIPARFI